jgi:hypothetical protein
MPQILGRESVNGTLIPQAKLRVAVLVMLAVTFGSFARTFLLGHRARRAPFAHRAVL